MCGSFFSAGFCSSSQHPQRTADRYAYYEFISKLINPCYTPFQVTVELFDTTTPNDVLPLARSQILNSPRQWHQMGTTYLNAWDYGDIYYLNYHTFFTEDWVQFLEFT